MDTRDAKVVGHLPKRYQGVLPAATTGALLLALCNTSKGVTLTADQGPVGRPTKCWVLSWSPHRSLDHICPTFCGYECSSKVLLCTDIVKGVHLGHHLEFSHI